MPASLFAPGVVRPSAVVNAEIRALAGRIALSAAERVELAELWAEWADAVKAEEERESAA